MDDPNVAPTFGALLLGGLIAASLSGVVWVQSLLYIKLFPDDRLRLKLTVGAIWVLDLAHSILVYASIWSYLIAHFGDFGRTEIISKTLALTVTLTGILTFIVHCFFAHRIHRLSRNDWRISALLVVLAFLRLCSATATTAEMIHLQTFTQFKASFRWLFTLGLALSCAVDILIAGCLTYSLQTLQSHRKASSSLDRVINTVILYTFETNSLTSAATIVSMVCWLSMPNNLVFMGLHFFICKLYANSLLATLNTRKQLQNQRQRVISADFAVTLPRFSRPGNYSSRGEPPMTTKGVKQLEINVEQTVECATEFVPGRVSPVTPQSPNGKRSLEDARMQVL